MTTTRKHSDTGKQSKDETQLTDADLESAEASDKAATEVSFRDPQCAEQGRHRANCDCKGAARAPITPAS